MKYLLILLLFLTGCDKNPMSEKPINTIVLHEVDVVTIRGTLTNEMRISGTSLCAVHCEGIVDIINVQVRYSWMQSWLLPSSDEVQINYEKEEVRLLFATGTEYKIKYERIAIGGN